MFFSTAAPTIGHRQFYAPAARSLERFLDQTMQASRNQAGTIEQDEKSFTLRFDVPGIGRDQLGIGIEGNIVRIESKAGAPRQYKAAYELPADIDVNSSEAKLENGVLTLKLGKLVPASRVTELLIN